MIENVQSNVTVSYTLWIGTYLKRIHHINISAPKNTSFYEVMKLAAEQNNHYKFQVNLAFHKIVDKNLITDITGQRV